jgi:homoserine O-acetyltransferase/O-succinyltransferase
VFTPRATPAAAPRLFDLRLPPLRLVHGGMVQPHHARFQWWGPESDLPRLERLATQVPEPERVEPVRRAAPVSTRLRQTQLDSAVPTVLLVHALTGDARAAGRDGWWEPLVGPGRPFDPAEVRILCVNNLGSCYGSSGPLDADWPDDAGPLTPWDQARALWSVLDVLGIERLRFAGGGSLGGMITLCLPVLQPGRVERILPIGTCAAASAWVVGWNHVARQVLRLDPGWPDDVGRGLELARQLAILTYRAEPSLDARQHRTMGRRPEPPWPWPVQSYLEHQGRKLRRRFDARAYLLQLEAMDQHDLDTPPPEISISWLPVKALCVDIDSDQLFTPAQADLLAHWLTTRGAEVEQATLTSPHGHDAFLIEWDSLASLVRRLLGPRGRR